ncbi:MAG: chorismate synthase [Spirochaetaceae bacterium]|nr:chorismate synthase [Spirochaetaceae bacterium]
MNSFGRVFKVSIFGESHGKEIGVVIDGVPPGIAVAEKDFEKDLLRRKPGKQGTTTRIESDMPKIISGIYNGKTSGSPITIIFENKDTKSCDYEKFIDMPRPGHADFTSNIKYKGFNDLRGSGHFSGRLTAPLVAAGVVAKKILDKIEISALLIEAGGASDIESAVKSAEEKKDSIGGIVECRIKNIKPGLGEPFFDSFESMISHIIFAIPGIRGIEFGTGFKAVSMKGSEHNDAIISADGKTATNNHGGINGGITNSNEVVFRVAVKPTSTISAIQKTYNFKINKIEELAAEGRHDTCFALRIPPVIEAATAIAIADFYLINKIY